MICEQEYRIRRDKLVLALPSFSVSVLFSGTNKTRSNDTNYPFRQDSNFYYMTGFKEDNSILMIVKEKKKYKSFLFVHKKDKTDEMWNGKRLGAKRAKQRFQVDEIYTKDEFEKRFKDALDEKKSLCFDFGLDYSKVKILKRYAKTIAAHINIAPLIGKMRLIKSEAEIKIIKDAIDITKKAHHQLMRLNKTSKYEYELQSSIEYIFKKNGAYNDAYTSIVAAANNANTLHYIENNKILREGELILIDAGCEFDYYASDITRTIPVSGYYTKPQKDLYSLVLSVEKNIISMIKPGILRSELQRKSEELLIQGMQKLGILNGSYKKILKEAKHKAYYPHGIGHWMGLDVHDTCPYRDENFKEIPLEEGMILTIEPALYIDKDDTKVPKKYRGIGIRIEDDILVTKTGYENLSKAIVKEILDIENLN